MIVRQTSEDRILDAVRASLGDYPFADWQLALLSIEWFLDTEDTQIIDEQKQRAALKKLGASLLDALKAYEDLNPSIRRQVEADTQNRHPDLRLTRVATVFSCGDDEEPITIGDPFGFLLKSAVGQLYGLDPEDPRLQVLARKTESSRQSASESFLEGALPIGPKEGPAETWQKAVLVSRARQVWTWAGRNPPKKPSDGSAFLSFVEDLINAMDKDWDAASTINAWRKRKSDMDSYGIRS